MAKESVVGGVEPSFSLRGKVAVVTGALGLLGRQHCRALLRHGATLVMTDLDHRLCEAAAADLEAEVGGEAHGFGADLTNPSAVTLLRDRVVASSGRLDILVNNAAVNDRFNSDQEAEHVSRFENYPLVLWERALAVNVTGMFLCCQILGAVMAERQTGSIINVASTYGMVAPDQSLYRRDDGTQAFWKSAAYPTTKGAVLSFTRFLASYWGPKRVRVNSLSPGGVRESTQDEDFVERYAKRTMLGRMAESHELQGALVFLASDASSYVTGTNLVVDGGWTAW
jgi:NAD(P)-dependent dehydrogenase (short-subunit alcohol dehydrogenase family)